MKIERTKLLKTPTINKKLHNFVLNACLLLFSLIIVIFVPNRLVLAVAIIAISFFVLWRFKSNSYLLILFGIIFYINLSTSFSEILGLFVSLGYDTLSWQEPIRKSTYWIVGAKSMLLMLSTINLFLPKKMLLISNKDYRFDSRNNSLVFYVGYAFLWVVWLFFSYSSSSFGGGYVSNTTTLYEYCLVICPILWIYSNKTRKHIFLIAIFAVAYCLKSFLHGDRSSMIPMGLFLFLILFGDKKIKLRHILVLAIIGLIVSNVVSIIRVYSFTTLEDFFRDYFLKYGSSFLTSDTVSQSYYTSVVTQMTADDIGGGAPYFFDFLGAIILGGGFRNGNVSNIVIQHYTNKFGGFYYSWPYFWFGYAGVIVFSIILALILGTIFSKNTNYTNVLKIVVVVFSFRWYLYTCFDFFRGCLFVTSVLYFVFYVFYDLTKGTYRKRRDFGLTFPSYFN